MKKSVSKIVMIFLVVFMFVVMSVPTFAEGIGEYANAVANFTGDTIIFYVIIAVTAFCGLIGIIVFGGDHKRN